MISTLKLHTAIFYIAATTITLFSLLQHQHYYISCEATIATVFEGGDYDIRFIHNVTKYLHKTYRYNSFVTFCKNRESYRESFLLVRSLEQALVEDFGAPIIVWGTERSARLRNNIGLNNLIFVNIASAEDPMLETVADTMEGLHYMSMIFFFKRSGNSPPTQMELNIFFLWCQNNNIVNVALTFQTMHHVWNETLGRDTVSMQNHLFSYTLFPEMAIHNITDHDYSTHGGFVLDAITDVKGFIFRTPIFMDPPLVFLTRFEKYPNVGDTEFAISGTAGLLYVEFIKRMNGVIEIYEIPDMSLYEYREYAILSVVHKFIHIGIQPFSGLIQFAHHAEGSYPIRQTNACIIVPFVPEIHQPEYLLRSYTTPIWILILFTLIGICILQLLFSYNRLRPHRLHLASALIYTFRTMVAQPLPSNEFQQRQHLRYKFLHLFLIGLCMILCSIYGTSLTSLLSTTVLGYQIENVHDLLQSGIQILMDEYEKHIYFDSGILPSALFSRLRIVDVRTLAAHREALNTSFAYVVTAEKWILLNIRQQRLWKPLFRIASDSLCTAQYFVKYPLQWDSPFYSSLTAFSMKALESGLLKRWEDLSFQHAIKMKLIEIIKDVPDHWIPLHLTHLSMAIAFYIGMMICALLCFIYEVVEHRWMLRKITNTIKIKIRS